MTFEVRYGDTVYMSITTPSKGAQGAQGSDVATVTTYNGASADLSRIVTWMGEPQSNGGNSRVPTKASDFETVNLRLPPDVPADGRLVLEWIPADEGGTYTDDLMISQVQFLEAEVVETDVDDDGDDTPAYEPELTDIDLLEN